MLTQFIPHGHCYLWKTNLVGLHLISDLLIALAYYSIPITLFYFARKRKDLPYASVFILFGAFIFSCGTVHLVEIWTLWHPTYWLAGFLKAITALISVYTAMTMFEIVPQALNMPSQAELEKANSKLQQEIEDRKQIETDLAHEQAFVKAMLDNLSDGIVACDRHGVLSLFNQAAIDLHGLPQEAIPADRWSEHFDLYLPDCQTPLPTENIPLFRALKGESVTDFEMAIVPKQGKPRILVASANPILDGNAQQIGAVAIMQNVTATREAQGALQTNQSILQSFYDSAPMMMGIVESLGTDDFCHVFDNQMAANFFSLIPETMKTKRSSELNISLEVRRQLNRACWQSLETQQPVQFESTYPVGKSTKHFSLTVAAIAETSAAGLPLFSYIVQDISDRKRIETVLQESEERFRLAFEDAPVGMAIVDLDGLLLQVNNSICEIVGYTRAELTQLNFRDITHPEDLELDLQHFHRLLAGEIPNYQLYKRYIHKLGHSVWILLSVSIVRNMKGEPEYFIAQIQDVTEQKTAQMKLEQSVQEKEVMLQEIHHRVKNNLQVICSLLNLQSRYLKEEKTIKAFKETQSRIKSMALVHEQLYQSNNLSEIVLSDYIKQLAGNLLRAYSLTAKVKLSLDIADFNLDLDTAVPCGLIINELITNAIKYAFPVTKPAMESEISIRAASNSEDRLALSIRDNGVGLKPDYDPENSTSLGLRLVRNLTEQLQGSYEIVTEPNAGTKFEFTFNRIKQEVR